MGFQKLASLLWAATSVYAASVRIRYERLVVFGDSFSDVGNGAWEVSNHTWPADPAYFNHTFSNGPIYSQTLRTTLHTTLHSYATGGATTSSTLVQGFTGPNSTIPVPSAHTQLLTFLSTTTPRPTDLFIHWIAANDPLFDPTITAPQSTSQINASIDLLYRAGAKTVLLANYPPLSWFPAMYNDTVYQEIGPTWAAGLSAGLASIQAAWGTYMDVRFVNVEALFEDLFRRPEVYGVDARYVDPPTACLEGTYGTGERRLCADPERHVFWDAYHPVKEVHERIAELFLEALGL